MTNYTKFFKETPAVLASQLSLAHIPDADDLDLPKLVAPSVEFMEDLQDDAEYATYDDKTTDVDAPANVNEDNELPPYSIFARFWQTDKPLRYPRIPKCGHKFRAEFEPNHRNCESCWFTYMTTHKDLVEAVEEAYQKGGPAIIAQLKGKTFLHNFLKYMSTIAFLKQQQDKAKETDESTTRPSSNESNGKDPWESPAYIGGGSVAD